ncbi:MAG: exodeoxyribonuclease V subunit alpha [Parachlamydiaceae bacterium]|nr:exodeoxyribonuclease V subunit alpha [Parachlamydiaceae bacterium]
MKLFKQPGEKINPSYCSAWPKLSKLLAKNYLTYIDIAIAEEMLQTPTEENEAAAALICHLSAASRQGHLCIEIEMNGITPSLLSLWEGNKDEGDHELINEQTYRFETSKEIEELVLFGRGKIPAEIITELPISEEDPKALKTFLCIMGSRYYFHRNWYFETLFFYHYQRLFKTPPAIEFDRTIIDTRVSALQKQNKLLKEQADAITNSSYDSLTMISGGPGTGKTYTAGLLVDILCEALQVEQKQTFTIALAAPTGKAAANLQKSLLKAMKGFSGASQPQAKTLHSLLGLRGSEAPIEPLMPLPADLVIVDESSMIDVRLMSYLFAAIKPGARLILLGDPLQLPAVESGSLFADLINSAQLIKSSASVELKTCLRAELKGIVDFATAIKAGDTPSCLKILEDSSIDSGVHRLRFEQADVKEICAHALPFFRTNTISKESSEVLLRYYDRFRILSPFRKGPYGVESINAKILRELRKDQAAGTPFIAPIILVRTDPRLELFNGEAGVLVRKSSVSESIYDGDFAQGDYAIFPSRGEGEEVRTIPALLLPAFEYAYCLSVHKSQGSEFDHVLLLLPEGSEVFGREVLYTAVTRARKKLELWDQPGALEKTIARQSYRFSGIAKRCACIYSLDVTSKLD